MNRFFRKLPLAVKLILIGLVPLIFLIYLTIQVYHEKNDKLKIIDNYVERIHQSANLSALINALENERKVSFDYSLGKARYSDVYQIRPLADSLLQRVEESGDPAVERFKEYTSVDRLLETRKRIDSSRADPNTVMHNYSNTIFRLNTLNTIPNSPYLQPEYRDMVAQKLLTEMSTYLGIIRSNIYNVLITKKYMVETLIGLTGTFDVYKSYEKELLLKATSEVRKAYQNIRAHTDLKTTNEYLNTLFNRFVFDSSLSADQWWQVSNNGLNELSALQKTIWKNIEAKVSSLYKNEKASRDRTLFLLVAILIILTALISFTVISITTMLHDLKLAAQKIARGSTEITVKKETNDVIGNLADCIAEIARSNSELSDTAKAIGNGNFNVKVLPRSEEDVLSNAIIQMKDELSAYSERMEALVKHRTDALEKSNRDLQQFAHVVSHDLKEPLRKIRTFTERLMMDDENQLTENSKNYLAKIAQASSRMSKMIDGILTYSSAGASNESFELVDLKTVVENVKSDLEVLIQQKHAVISIGNLPQIEGAPVLLNQLMYNLLNNSLKFSKEGVAPVIRFECKKLAKEKEGADGNYCYEIMIEDNGIGFEPEYAEKIFNTFSRLHSQSQYEGTGLGLALCKRIVEYHGGKIWAESEGDGSVFTIVLPQKQKLRSVANN